MDYLQKISDFFIIFGLFWLLKLHFAELWLIWEEGKMQDDPRKKRIVSLQSKSITMGSAESPILLYCQVVSLTLLQAACADYSNNEDAHLPLFHLWTKWIVFSCWSDWEKSIEKCFENFIAVKIGNWYRHSFAHFIPHFKKLGWLPCLSLLQIFGWSKDNNWPRTLSISTEVFSVMILLLGYERRLWGDKSWWKEIWLGMVEHTIKCIDDVFWSCALESCVILLVSPQ